MKILPILLFLSVTSFAQGLREQMIDLVGYRYQEETTIEVEYTARLMDGFLRDDEAGLDKALSTIDRSKVSGIDVYIGQDEEAMMEEIARDKEASFRSIKMKVIRISQVDKEGWEIVVIYSYR